MNIIVNELNTQVRFGSNRPLPEVAQVLMSLLYCFFEETLVFLTVGEEKGAGLFVLAGPSDLVAKLGPQ